MSEFAFDTHRAVKRLQAAGFESPQAEAVVDAIAVANGDQAGFATKADLDAAVAKLDGRIDDVEETLGKRIDDVEETLGKRFDELEETLGKRIGDSNRQLREVFDLKMANLRLGMIVWMYTGLAAMVALIKALDYLLD